MSTRIYPAEFRQRVLDDYYASNDPASVVARRHGMSPSTLINWITPDDLALTGGRWVGRGGIQRWEEYA